ncbi:laccase [Paxillus rubicundulus Ve08.2h10]|uniref:Laccase n=1 Tax=Paxillus rubicundulus Ve08.2h10 TaxID=930991 RepID=A0A0D0DFM5_9AGAM|nr:laccase [Paxillus rubicundulus Ve08.2h10]
MRATSAASLSFLLSLASTLSAVSLVAKPDAHARSASDRPNTPNVITASSGELEITNKVIAPDGYARRASLAGGSFPGPLIKAQKGDNFSINVINKLQDPTMDLTTTIHWHGIFQNRSNWADGVSFVTQCPIQPNQKFLYQFNADDQTGTYWYHSHHALQYCDGVRGPLVIYDPDDPHAHMYDVDDETTVITLSDWYHQTSRKLTQPYTPNATLINGLGRHMGGPMSPLSVFSVDHGTRYRFRIVGASCDAWFNFTIDGHKMTIIEVDGVETIPVEVDSLPVLAGQRYSVVVTADRPVGNYWIRALPSIGNQTFDHGLNSAVLRYAGAPIQDPTTKQGPFVAPFEESQLHPLNNPGAPGVPELGKADVNINLVPGFNNGFTINGRHFLPPPAPVLLQMLSGARHPSELLPSGSVYELPRNKVIEINMPATDLNPGGAIGGPHGIHLHGHAFHVIRTSTNSTPNFVNPVKRDTVSMGSQAQTSNITFRFVTNNAGPWILHCHIDFHLFSGFGVVMAEAPEAAAVQQSGVVPADWRMLCPAPILKATAIFNTTGEFDLAAFNITTNAPRPNATSVVMTSSHNPNASGPIITTSQSPNATGSLTIPAGASTISASTTRPNTTSYNTPANFSTTGFNATSSNTMTTGSLNVSSSTISPSYSSVIHTLY